jgi:hypothetical protein
MLYIQKGQFNELTLNINNNARPNFATYVLVFTHTMSGEVKSYTIDTDNPAEYFSNIRYCEIGLDLITDDLNYLGQYSLNIYGDGTDLVYVGLAHLVGTESQENPFIEYISPNEIDTNYIYIK